MKFKDVGVIEIDPRAVGSGPFGMLGISRSVDTREHASEVDAVRSEVSGGSADKMAS